MTQSINNLTLEGINNAYVCVPLCQYKIMIELGTTVIIIAYAICISFWRVLFISIWDQIEHGD